MSGRGLVIDATVPLALVVGTADSAAASHLFRRCADEGIHLWAPDLIHAEVLAALRRLLTTGALSASAARRAAAWLPNLPLTTSGTRHLIPGIWLLGDRLSPQEGAYAALAARLEVPLVSTDDLLVDAVRERGRDALRLSQLYPG